MTFGSLEGDKAIPLKGKALESYLEFQTSQQHKAAKEWSAAKKRGFGSQVVMHPAVWLPGKGKHEGFVSRGDKFERLAHEHELAAQAAEAAAARAKLLAADSAPEHRTVECRRSLSSLEHVDQYHSASTTVSAVWGGLMPTDYRRGTPVVRPKSRGVLTLHALEQAAAAQTFPSTAFKAASWKAGRNGSGKEKMNQLFVPDTTGHGIGGAHLYGGPMDRSGWNCGVPGKEMWSDKPGTLRDARGRNSELPARPEGWRSAVPAKFSKSAMLKQSRNPNTAGVLVSTWSAGRLNVVVCMQTRRCRTSAVRQQQIGIFSQEVTTLTFNNPKTIAQLRHNFGAANSFTGLIMCVVEGRLDGSGPRHRRVLRNLGTQL